VLDPYTVIALLLLCESVVDGGSMELGHDSIQDCLPWVFVSIWDFVRGSSIGESHTGLVDGYGCHRGADKVSYHCHQGQFAGRTFKSKDDFLRELRGGKSPQLAPKENPPQPQRKPEK
jgi:hypothetical protein